MTARITWLGHNCWSIETGGKKLLLDPFLDDSPTAPIKSSQAAADYILVSHGHFDHVADAAKIAKRTGAIVISNWEICHWLGKQGVQSSVAMNLGGWTTQTFGRLQLTLAHHSSMLPDGSNGGNPSGFLLRLGDKSVYFACDTALFSDMQLIGRGALDLAVLPIGDLFTMGPDDSIEAIRLLRPKRVAPAHYNTWPPIEQDAHAWADRVRRDTEAEPIVLEPGGVIDL
jgi:L-ascorbate metabolism protein UlaG (beta-lactamase superfamily)